jgi:hypothetical protein
VPEEIDMTPIVYRINKGNWKDIEYFRGQTIGYGDAIEYAYSAPVVTDEMVKRVAIAISGAPFPSARSMDKARAAIAALKTTDV